LGKPEEVAAAVVFLLSEAAHYITGTAIVMDGGSVRV
jgi:NAD(P)-dependent dehydrogenase (short-subunit alcohol dehydrogenase family)